MWRIVILPPHDPIWTHRRVVIRVAACACVTFRRVVSSENSSSIRRVNVRASRIYIDFAIVDDLPPRRRRRRRDPPF